jgi:hypothetical protein
LNVDKKSVTPGYASKDDCENQKIILEASSIVNEACHKTDLPSSE